VHAVFKATCQYSVFIYFLVALFRL
jgi:hypothetical protein